MSVAFRRESDDEHKEPRFELPLPPGPNLVTRSGLAAISARVAELEAAIDGAADDEARTAIRRDLRYWRTRETTAEIAPPPPDDEAAFGSRVTYRLNGKTATVDLVGSDEADPAAGRIPFTAPIAQAMIGAGVGDRVDFAGREEAIEIVALTAIPEAG